MVIYSVLLLFFLVFSILVVPGIVGLIAILYGIYLAIKGNKNDCIKKICRGLVLILLGIIAFLNFRFNINFELENQNNKIIEEYKVNSLC